MASPSKNVLRGSIARLEIGDDSDSLTDFSAELQSADLSRGIESSDVSGLSDEISKVQQQIKTYTMSCSFNATTDTYAFFTAWIEDNFGDERLMAYYPEGKVSGKPAYTGQGVIVSFDTSVARASHQTYSVSFQWNQFTAGTVA